MNHSEANKVCSRCGDRRGPLPLAAFDRDRRAADGRRSICKRCRHDRRQHNLQEAHVGGTPNNAKTPHLGPPSCYAKELAPGADPANGKTGADSMHRGSTWQTLRQKVAVVWPGVLFLGGFGWSTLNGTFAFSDTAISFLPNSGWAVGVLAASVLTLGTAVSASWVIRFVQLKLKLSATLMILIFIIIQSLNLVVNHAGVQTRLALTGTKKLQANQQATIAALQRLKTDYRKVIERYPPTDNKGEPIVWKSEITQEVKHAHEEIRQLNAEIKAEHLNRVEPNLEFDWRIVLAWLLLPELCMLSAISVFTLGLSKGDRCEFKK